MIPTSRFFPIHGNANHSPAHQPTKRAAGENPPGMEADWQPTTNGEARAHSKEYIQSEIAWQTRPHIIGSPNSG